MKEPDIKQEKTFGSYLAKRKAWTAQELAAAGGPMGRLVAQEAGEGNIINDPKTEMWQIATGTSGEANVYGRDIRSSKTREVIKEGQAHTYSGNAEEAVHEGAHLLENRAVTRRKGGKWTDTPQVPGDKSAHKHDFIEAMTAYNATTKEAAEAALSAAEARGESRSSVKAHAKTMAEEEYKLGARLMLDPARGHGGREVATSAMESLIGGKAAYIKYRNRQSYIGRGEK